jgi:predicted oxidoreductase
VIAPLERAPFYGIRLVIGDLGTYAGIKTDEHARALDGAGRPIPGLYAAGNDMASIIGGNYPGAGITLGPALTFGYLAGKHMANIKTGRQIRIAGAILSLFHASWV